MVAFMAILNTYKLKLPMEHWKYEPYCQGKCVQNFRLYKNMPKRYWQYSKSDPCAENSKLTILTSGISIENL